MDLKGSDFSAQPIPPGESVVQALVQHPEYGDRRLDIAAEEAAKLADLAMKEPVVVLLQSAAEGFEQQRLILSKANFAKMATRASAEVVMGEAKPLIEAPAPRSRSSGPARDYNTPEWAGFPHRGTTSDDEAAYVREHLDEVNERLAAAGKRRIDPENPEHATRYGFDGSRDGGHQATLDAAGASAVQPTGQAAEPAQS